MTAVREATALSCTQRHDMCFKKSPGYNNFWHRYRFCMCANPVDLLSSQWNVPFKMWLFYRVAIAFTTAILWLSTMIVGNKFVDILNWIYLSQWGFMCVPIVLMAEMVALIKYRSYLTPNRRNMECPKPLVILWIASNIITHTAIFITISFWYGTESREITFQSVNIHILNSVWMIIDQWMHKKPPRWGHVYQPMSMLLLLYVYCYFFYCMGWRDENGKRYVYYVFDWDYPVFSIANSFLGVLYTLFLWCLVYGMGRWRGFIAEKEISSD